MLIVSLMEVNLFLIMRLKIWESIPSEIKQVSSLSEFKNKIKRWKLEECPCRIYKHYIAGAGFTEVFLATKYNKYGSSHLKVFRKKVVLGVFYFSHLI